MDDSLTVKQVVEEGVKEVVETLKAYEEVNLKFGNYKIPGYQKELTFVVEHTIQCCS